MIYPGLIAIILAGWFTNSLAQCPLQSSFDAWQEYSASFSSLVDATDQENWETVVHLSESALENSIDQKEKTFLNYHLANALIQSGKGKQAMPILNDTTWSSFNPEAGMEYFHVMINKLGLNFVGRFADPKLALNHLDGLKPWMTEESCDSLIDLQKIYRNAGELYFYRIGSSILAEDYFNRAYDTWNTGGQDSTVLPRLLYNLAVVKNASDQQSIALEYIEQAISIAKEYSEKHTPTFLMDCMNIMGMIYYNWHKLDSTISTLNRLIQLRETDADPYKYDNLLGEYWNLSIAYRKAKLYNESELAFKRLVELSYKTKETFDTTFYINLNTDLALLRIDEGRLDEADSLLAFSHLLIEELNLPYYYERFFCQLNQVRVLEQRTRYDIGLQILEPALEKMSPEMEEFFNSEALFHVQFCTKAGKLRIKLYDTSRNPNDYHLALNHYLKADSLLHHLRINNPWRPSSQEIAEHYRGVYENILLTTSKLYEITKDPDYLNDAFRTMERNKALLLSESRERNKYTSFGHLAEDTVRMIQDLESSIVGLSISLRSEENSADKLKLDKAQLDYRDLMATINDGFVDRSSIVDLVDWNRNTNRSNQAWIQYFMGDSTLFSLCGFQKELSIDAITLTPQLVAAMDSLIYHVSNYRPDHGFTDFVSNSQFLYEELIPDLIKGQKIKKVIIIPDGPLSYFPFEVLLTEEGAQQKGNYRDLPYWVKEVSISYGMSSSLWQIDHSSIDAQLMSINYSSEQFGLPSSNLESERLEASWKGTFFPISTKQQFFQNAPTADILHFATHAEAGLSDGKENRIRLCDHFIDPSCTIEGYELLGLDLNEKLVILNACETNYGQVKKGEGIFSLSRDFAMAGVSTIVSNLWKVEDNAAQEIVVSMMERWPKDKQLSEALTNSKRQYIKASSAQGAHPFYWAGTIIIGESELESNNKWKKSFYILIIVILGIFAWRGVRKQRE